MKKLIFDTKENNNRRREQEFLALPPNERFQLFLKDVDRYAIFATNAPVKDKGNFVIEKKKK